MSSIERKRRRLFVVVAFAVFFFLLFNSLALTGDKGIPIPGGTKPAPALQDILLQDSHPIRQFMDEADHRWTRYEKSRSLTFRETVCKYRRKYGRHPPPGFKEWYKYARKKNVHNIDDFDQIMDDLRPFWGVKPQIIRNLAAHMGTHPDGSVDESISGLHIRNHTIWKHTNPKWRSNTLASLIQKFIKYLPDMDIAMNELDQPRVVVPWEDMQDLLSTEVKSRQILPDARDEWTSNISFLLREQDQFEGNIQHEDPEWFDVAGKQYMEVASTACPPNSPARNQSISLSDLESLYKHQNSGIVNNFNSSTDLCTVGPKIQNQHGLLFSSSSMIASKRLLPVFGECKVNVNSDILFPANMYWTHDPRYHYDAKYDLDWSKKQDVALWRGVTSGGVQNASNWNHLHRQRFVLLFNSTQVAGKHIKILSEDLDQKGSYQEYSHFQPSNFAANHTDIGFTEMVGCIPSNCEFLKEDFSPKSQIELSQQFKAKYLIDVDGHSFSGRWRAFLLSKSLGIKATIFREWHDSRLFEWRHFVPMDNSFDDAYTLLTYFVGLDSPKRSTSSWDRNDDHPIVQPHDAEGNKIARQGREWAQKVLRDEDIEIYTFRLMLEYARIIDDNRDAIGYSGDGRELDHYDMHHRF
ncbi:MAG: hypothetical protein M1829_004264 [Trizodia sp. TS-e1964]|nr:MAG: hypothetical protein M1829_004264 [Trizodia sp. TS-e1964]